MHNARQRAKRGPRAVLYARISTSEDRQNYRQQLQALRRVAQHRGWTVVGQFHDVISGRHDKRPGLDEALAVCRAGGADIFAATAVDRIARSTINFIRFFDRLQAMKVQLACVNDAPFDTTTPEGEAALVLRAVYAQLEVKITSRRIKDALAEKRAAGVKLGAPRTYDYRKLPTVRKLRRRKVSWPKIAQRFGGTPGGWQRAVDRAAA